MMENVGLIDRMIRFVVAIVFIIIGFTVSPWWFIVAAVALVTGLMGWCGLYTLLGINTSGKPAKKAVETPKKKSRRK
jgi:hypothetical protein